MWLQRRASGTNCPCRDREELNQVTRGSVEVPAVWREGIWKIRILRGERAQGSAWAGAITTS